MQRTLASIIEMSGIGLHSGEIVCMRLLPAEADAGITFIRTDIESGDNAIPARWDMVVDTRLCSVIANKSGASVGTIEHLMAALRGCGVDNVMIELDAAEVPVMDGSSAPFVKAIDGVGTIEQDMPRRAIKILKTIEIEEEGKIARLVPAEGSYFTGKIDFDHKSIGTQEREVQLLNGNFRHDIADARTFGFLHEVEAMRAAGLARGGSLDNAIVLNEEGVMNEDGLRFEDEFIRHKLLDAIGDLYLAGGPILGSYEAEKPGHAMNNKILHALFADEDAWMLVDVYGDEVQTAPASALDTVTALAAE